MGVSRLFEPEGGKSFVGFSLNLVGTMKRLRFELTLNASPNKELQALWNRCGNLEMEVLEELQYDCDMSEFEIDAHLRAMQMRWQEKLGEGTYNIQESIKA